MNEKSYGYSRKVCHRLCLGLGKTLSWSRSSFLNLNCWEWKKEEYQNTQIKSQKLSYWRTVFWSLVKSLEKINLSIVHLRTRPKYESSIGWSFRNNVELTSHGFYSQFSKQKHFFFFPKSNSLMISISNKHPLSME